MIVAERTRFSAENSATQATAEKALRDVFKTPEGQKLIKNVVLKSKNGQLQQTFERTFKINRDLGKGFESSNGAAWRINQPLTRVQLILKPIGKGGFEIISFFPVK